MIAALVVFWLCFAVCTWIYFGYPAFLFLLSRVRPHPAREHDITPFVSFIIAAHDEEEVIGEKLENTLSLDYPEERMEILVVSNGSSDATETIVASYGDPRVELISLERPGKMEALNHGARRARGEILVLTDADFFLDRRALRSLVRKFADPEVGGVCGEKRNAPEAGGDTTGEGENLYWRYDSWQKRLEGEIGSVFAADGRLYAVRRELYVPISDPAQADDIAISTRVVLQGYRLQYEPGAFGYETGAIEGHEEFRRKIRVTNHSVRALLNLGSRLWSSGFYSVELLSHKLIRHLIPFFLIPLFASNVLLAFRSPFYRLVLVLHVAFYLLALLGAALRSHPIGRLRLLYIPYFFALVNTSAFLGISSILEGKRVVAWRSSDVRQREK